MRPHRPITSAPTDPEVKVIRLVKRKLDRDFIIAVLVAVGVFGAFAKYLFEKMDSDVRRIEQSAASWRANHETVSAQKESEIRGEIHAGRVETINELREVRRELRDLLRFQQTDIVPARLTKPVPPDLDSHQE